MTFVLAKKTKSQIFIFADTRITDADGVTALKPDRGIIKTAFIAPHIAVSFANSPEAAIESIQELASSKSDFLTVTKHLQNSSSKSGNDYLIAFADTLSIVKITEGKVKRSAGTVEWIGDYAAFKKFRSFEVGEKCETVAPWTMTTYGPLELFKQPHDKFGHWLEMVKSVHQSSDIPGVGDFMTVALSVDGSFRFLLNSSLYFDALSRDTNVLGQQKLTASGENLEFRYASLTPKQAGTNAIGFYFPAGKLAYVFHPEKTGTIASKCSVYKNVTLETLLPLLEKDLGISFDYFFPSHFPG